MKNLPLWTKTLAVVSLTALGTVACDSGTESTVGVDGAEQSDTYTQGEQNVGTGQGEAASDTEIETRGSGYGDQYGQQGTGQQTTTGGAQTGQQSNDQMSGTQPGQTQNDQMSGAQPGQTQDDQMSETQSGQTQDDQIGQRN